MPVPTRASIPWSGWLGLGVGVDGTEIASGVGGYARMPVTFDWTADGITVANEETVEWPIATADWGHVTSVLIYDAPTGGVWCGEATTTISLSVTMYQRARLQAGAFWAQFGATPTAFGTWTWGVGRYGARTFLFPTGIPGIGVPYNTGGYGFGPYQMPESGTALLEVTFDTSQHVCEPGTWAPAPYSLAA